MFINTKFCIINNCLYVITLTAKISNTLFRFFLLFSFPSKKRHVLREDRNRKV